MDFMNEFSAWGRESDWVKFARAFFEHMGWECLQVEDGMYVVFDGEIKYLLSPRHNARSGAVGTEKETDILDRIDRCGASGFIGFYSGDFSTALYSRLSSLAVPFFLFNGARIAIYLAYANSYFVDEYFGNGERGATLAWRYYKNKKVIRPLRCVCGCGFDVLDVKNVSYSLALLQEYKGGLYFIYGSKSCFRHLSGNTACGWMEVNQLLHLDQFISWGRTVDEFVQQRADLDFSKFYPQRRKFQSGIMQRMRPINAGFFLGGEY